MLGRKRRVERGTGWENVGKIDSTRYMKRRKRWRKNRWEKVYHVLTNYFGPLIDVSISFKQCVNHISVPFLWWQVKCRKAILCTECHSSYPVDCWPLHYTSFCRLMSPRAGSSIRTTWTCPLKEAVISGVIPSCIKNIEWCTPTCIYIFNTMHCCGVVYEHIHNVIGKFTRLQQKITISRLGALC